MRILRTIPPNPSLDRPSYLLVGKKTYDPFRGRPWRGDTWLIPATPAGRKAAAAKRWEGTLCVTGGILAAVSFLWFSLPVFSHLWVIITRVGTGTPIPSYRPTPTIGIAALLIVLGLSVGIGIVFFTEKMIAACPGVGYLKSGDLEAKPGDPEARSLPEVAGRDALELLADAAHEEVFASAVRLIEQRLKQVRDAKYAAMWAARSRS